jgi:hypothetical protein
MKHNNDSGTGVLYLAIGAEHCAYVSKSISQLRYFGYTGRIRVVTDCREREIAQPDVELIRVPGVTPGFSTRWYKTQLYTYSFERATLFLDSDTLCVASINAVWEELGTNDLCMAQDLHPNVLHVIENSINEPERRKPEYDWMALNGLTSHIYYNSGVMLFRRAPAVKSFFEQWHLEWLRFGHEDQLALVRALVKCDVSVRLLPEYWNRRPKGLNSIRDAQREGIKILHFLSRQRGYWADFHVCQASGYAAVLENEGSHGSICG